MKLFPLSLCIAPAFALLLTLIPARAQLVGLNPIIPVAAPATETLHVVRPNPAFPGQVLLGTIKTLLNSIGATLYAEIDDDASATPLTAVSAWLSPLELYLLRLDPTVIVSAEVSLTPNGINTDPDWALTHITGQSTNSYTYPDTTAPVRLYLIDTAVANPGDWIGANPKLTLEKSVLVRGNGDPTTSSAFKHGTQMLSLIGGKPTGASPGTPIRVVNYDIYPNGNSTTTTLLAKAVLDAIADHRDSTDGLPAAICIATSSTTAGSSYTLRSAIERAVSEGITVFVSSGNLGQDAGQYIPAAYGSIDGVVCTGATDRQDAKLSSSNYGSSVDLLAPGLALRTIPNTGGFTEMTGTSPACALTTALGLTEISRNTAATPATTEQTLKAATASSSAGVLLRTVPASETQTDPNTTTPVATYDATTDSDSDGMPDIIEIFHGSDANLSSSAPAASGIGVTPASLARSTPQMSITFPVDAALYDPATPYTLRNGITWSIECSAKLSSWTTAAASLSQSAAENGIIWLTATFPADSNAFYARLAIVPPPAP
ncbi:MAG: S8 family serine peptidase [Luteolibacter sp.]